MAGENYTGNKLTLLSDTCGSKKHCHDLATGWLSTGDAWGGRKACGPTSAGVAKMLCTLASAGSRDWTSPLGCCPPVWASLINCLNLGAGFSTGLRQLISSTLLDVAPGTPRLAFGPASSMGEADTGFNTEETQLASPPPPASSIVTIRKKVLLFQNITPCSDSPQIFPFSQTIHFTSVQPRRKVNVRERSTNSSKTAFSKAMCESLLNVLQFILCLL